MNRTTKALARLGTLAVVAGTALSAPFAVGAANATVPITFTIAGPTAGTSAGSQTTAATASAKNDDVNRHISVTPAAFTGTLTMSLVGSSAYFANPIPAGYVGSANNQTVTCAAPCAGAAILVDDNVAESAPLGASDTAGDIGTTSLQFNGINYTVSAQECPTHDIDTSGTINLSPPDGNCVTQGQVGTAINVTVHYSAGQVGTTDTNGAFRQLVVTISGPTTTQNPTIIGANPATPNTITCTTNASGDCPLQVVDPQALDTDQPAVAGHLGHDTITASITAAAATPFPAIGTQPTVGYACATPGTLISTTNPGLPGALPPATYCPAAALNMGPGGVATNRIDMTSAQLITPTNQASPNAEPGDAVQIIGHVSGSCTPAAPLVTCTGTPLAGVSVPLSIDKGFFTPNCEQTQSDNPAAMVFNFYGSCSFTTAPAGGSPVGNLTNSGATKSVVTNTAGNFVVTIGIGRDTGFDANGIVVATLTSGSITVTIPGDTRTTATPSCTTTTADNTVVPTTAGIVTLAASAVPPAVPAGVPGDYGDCSALIQWTTQQQPLNGGTAKISVVKALALPNNISIDTENNYNATDSGTVNVPDSTRVVWQVNVTDQFGNLTSYNTGTAPVALTKTGVGTNANCTGSSASDACKVPVALGTCTAQADGTFKQVASLAGTYQNLPVGPAPGTTALPQVRYQSEDRSQNCAGPFNDGYSTATPGVNDGTQTDVVSWAPPTTTFAAQTAGLWTYAAGTGTAATDTLTLNFYNQLAQPVVTFNVKPGNKVPTSTAVTIEATLVDQFGNPIVGTCTFGGACGGTTSGTVGGVGVITVVRSGQNEASCVPTQNTVNGNASNGAIITNTSGVAGYTFSCNAPGVSTVNLVVVGPGGTQLASGKEAITFTGAGVTRTVERPTVTLTSFHRHHLTVNIHTSPAVRAGHTVNVYRVINGLKHLVGQTHTGPRGNATLTFSGLRSRANWTVSVKVIGLGTQYRSEFSQAVSHRIK